MVKFQREKDALEALEAVQAYVKECLTDARLKARALQAELSKVTTQIRVLENRDNSLQQSKVHWVVPVMPEETPQIDSLDVIVSILESSSGPMRVKTIAEYAYNKGLITSSRGLSGVQSIVSNKVSQNSPKILTSVGWGWWDLAARRKPKTTAAPTESEPTKAVNNGDQAEETSGTERPTVH